MTHTAQSEAEISAATILVAASRARATFEKDFMVMMTMFRWVIRCVKVWGIKKKRDGEIDNRDGEENKVLLGFDKGSYRNSPRGGRSQATRRFGTRQEPPGTKRFDLQVAWGVPRSSREKSGPTREKDTSTSLSLARGDDQKTKARFSTFTETLQPHGDRPSGVDLRR